MIEQYRESMKKLLRHFNCDSSRNSFSHNLFEFTVYEKKRMPIGNHVADDEEVEHEIAIKFF